jgi:HD-GYP domain-containing protein (c-di-GMP phosphodiesterase class II)
VVDLFMRLAQEWKFDEERMQRIRRGALLHDIGKMAIPDEILFKRGPLTEKEWATMRRHTAFARDMLKGIPFLRPAMDIPYSHHERWDGTGYPRGLKGRRIPLEARIFAVVDFYDALSTPRPYRKAWPARKIMQEIEMNSGKRFDPEVVRVFRELFERNAFDQGS